MRGGIRDVQRMLSYLLVSINLWPLFVDGGCCRLCFGYLLCGL